MLPLRSSSSLLLGALLALSALACGDSSAPLTVDTTPPTVALTLSSDNVTTPGNLGLRATADDEAGVARVEFYERVAGGDAAPVKIGEDVSEPYHLERRILSGAENGSHEFTAKAYDAAGNVGNSNVETAVFNLEAAEPEFTISASHDRITTPGQISFSAEPAEGLSRMEIYERGIKVGESVGSAASPSVTIDVSSTQNGSRIYVAKGYGAGGEIGFSNPLAILVDIRWDVFRVLEGMGTDELLRLASDGSGAAYVATTIRTEVNAVINLDVVLSKYDAEGTRLWTRTFGGTDRENVYGLGVDPSGRPYLSGHIHYRAEGETRNPDCFLAVYDASGSLLWTRLADTPALEVLCGSATDASGAFYLAGAIEEGSPGSGRTDVVVAKYDADGNRLWIREFGSEPGVFGDDIPTGIAVDPLGGVYIAGYTSGSMDGTANQGGRDLFLVKLNGEGNRVWARQFGSSYHDFANGLAADPEGGAYVAGGRDHPDFRFGEYGDALLLRYGSDGTLLWNRQLDGGYFDDAWDVTADRDAVRLVGRTSRGTSGQLTEPTQGPSDAFLATFSRAGDLLSASLLGGAGHDGATGVAPGKDGNTWVALVTAGGLPGVSNPSPVLARQQETRP
jgi:hypothetical protein